MDTGSHRTRKTALLSPSVAAPIHDSVSEIHIDGSSYDLYDIRATGDVLLDVTFENQMSSSKIVTVTTDSVRPATTTKSLKTLTIAPSPIRTGTVLKNTKSPNTRVLYRVRLDTLKKTSKYFELLLTSPTFVEGLKVTKCLAELHARGVDPTKADPSELPRIAITDDDDATRTAGREAIFADLLRILHDGDIAIRPTIPYLTILAILADRFDCTQKIGLVVKRAPKKFPWPQTYGTMTMVTEEVLRQKILISWLLDDPVRFASATKELVLRGSLRWVAEANEKQFQATWWDLQDGLEAELHLRRISILSTLASLQSHFISLYTSRDRQCKQFYDSSAACDSYQLGEMIKFLSHKQLLFLISPLSPIYDDYPDIYNGDIETLITILRQCPSYQIDKNHVHCGLRTRILPALDHIQAILSSNFGIDRRGWKGNRPSTSWEGGDAEEFLFTRAMANDSRFKFENFVMGNEYAKVLFTAAKWNWSPEI